MDFGAIIKRAWQITWRYKALWALGVFAGVSGCQGGSSGSSYRTSSGDWNRYVDSTTAPGLLRDFQDGIQAWLPALIALSFVLIALGLVWAVFSIAAKGGLVVAVNELEEGRERRLGELWRIGFSRFWPLVGLGLLLNLPVLIVALVVVFATLIPVMTVLVAGSDSGAAFVPVCGGLAIGIPLLIVLGFILGVMYLIGIRYVMLGGQGPVEAARNSWYFFRNRFKDSFLMYLIGGALNIAASIVIAIPIVIIAIAAAIPVFVAIRAQSAAGVVGPVAIAGLLIFAVSLFYQAAWGTFSSSLWTVFFRQVTGMAAPPVVQPAVPAGYQPVPTQPYAPSRSPVAEPPVAEPPVADQTPPVVGSEPESPAGGA